MNRVIFYVDDEARNLAVFEASMPADWKVHTFTSPTEAIEKLESLNPALVISDQRMPVMNGVEFLSIVKKICPKSIRIIVTGYSDEDLVINSVRQAQVFDYIRKPWDVDELEASLIRAFEHYDVTNQNQVLTAMVDAKHLELQKKHTELQSALLDVKTQNLELLTLKIDLEKSQVEEEKLRKELECWVHPFVVEALKAKNIKFPMKRDLVGITYDIIDSCKIHDKYFEGRSVRSHILRAFSEAVMRYGGWRESSSGDSAYAHFGLMENTQKPLESAFAVASEMKTFLQNLKNRSGIGVECGIGIHMMKSCNVELHQANISTANGITSQKSFDTTSADVDLLHRIEKIAHALPGTNIIFTRDSLDSSPPPASLDFQSIGRHSLKGQADEVELCLVPSRDTKQLSAGDILGKLSTRVESQADEEQKAA